MLLTQALTEAKTEKGQNAKKRTQNVMAKEVTLDGGLETTKEEEELLKTDRNKLGDPPEEEGSMDIDKQTVEQGFTEGSSETHGTIPLKGKFLSYRD